MCSGVRVHLFLDMPRACEPVGIQYETYIEEDTVAKTCVFFCCHMELYRPMREVNYNIALDFVDNTSLNYVHCLCPRN